MVLVSNFINDISSNIKNKQCGTIFKRNNDTFMRIKCRFMFPSVAQTVPGAGGGTVLLKKFNNRGDVSGTQEVELNLGTDLC